MAIRLGDDGTMDTVLVCDECGHEARYNYDSNVDREDNPPDDWEECGGCAGHHPPDFAGDCREDVNRWPSRACIERLNLEAYEAWIDWCIEDMSAEHECDPDKEEIPVPGDLLRPRNRVTGER